MKQLQTTYKDAGSFAAWLGELKAYSGAHHLEQCAKLFYLASDSVDMARLRPVLDAVREAFPEAVYAGASGNGNICEGDLVLGSVSVSALLFEDPGTRAEVLQLPVSLQEQEASAAALVAAVKERPWVKAVEMMTTIGSVNMPKFCEDISAIPDEIRFFGGGALARDTHDGTSSDTFVFSSAGEMAPFSGVFVLLGGEQLHVDTRYITGWRGLGLPFEVTGAEGNVLKTLDGKPAFEVFQKYLKVPDDEQHFFDMAVVFPFSFASEEGSYLRVSTYHMPDGSIAIASDVQEHTMARFAYGDPAYIMNSIRDNVASVKAFMPDAIRLYSCASRQYYWGDDAVSRETLPFEKLAPTSGFYTSGEFLRTGHRIILHNVTMVVAAFREGEPVPKVFPELKEEEPFSRQIMINHCLTTFINTATEQIVEANRKLSEMAITDGLTGLFNRGEIERQIGQALEERRTRTAQTGKPGSGARPVLLMIDLDDFKSVNDTYGHQEGDEVLRRVAQIFRERILAKGADAAIGRWGGEEFMILVRDSDLNGAKELADSIRTAFAEYVFPISGSHTLSVGVTEALEEDNADRLCNRVDMGLYEAKNEGKNQSVVI